VLTKLADIEESKDLLSQGHIIGYIMDTETRIEDGAETFAAGFLGKTDKVAILHGYGLVEVIDIQKIREHGPAVVTCRATS
jgi:hypothetical protein